MIEEVIARFVGCLNGGHCPLEGVKARRVIKEPSGVQPVIHAIDDFAGTASHLPD